MSAKRFALRSALVSLLLLTTSLGFSPPSQETSPWAETRFRTGCDPGPYSTFQYPDPPMPPERLPRDRPENAILHVETDFNPDERPLLGAGFNFEHTLWSCPVFRPVFERELLEAFRPALARVNTGLLPAAPPDLPASALHRDVYQSVLASEPYKDSWRFLRLLNRQKVPIALGVWGGPAQFTDNGDRLGTLLPAHYDDYVEYVVSVVDFIVRREAVDVWAITVANEPDGGDGNHISPEGLAYIARQLAPRLAAYGVKLYGPDTANATAAMEYLPLLLDDPLIADALAFVGFHQYYPEPKIADVRAYVEERRPGLPVIITEYTSFMYGLLDDGQETVDPTAFMLDVTNTLLAHYRYGADAALYWDAVDYLQAGHDAITRWGLLRGPEDHFARRRWYYSFFQILPYLQPGARVLDSRQYGDTDISSLAVRTADEGIAVFLVNEGLEGVDLSLQLFGTDAQRFETAYVLHTDSTRMAEYSGRLVFREGYTNAYVPARSVTSILTDGVALPR